MANTKSKSKTTQKKSSLFSKINFGSTKTRIIVTLLVFGVIGGGFTVYKSFAAENNSAVIGSAQVDSTPIKETVTSTGKANNNVARLSPGETIKWFPSATTLANFNKYGAYRFCATVRFEAPSSSSKPAQILMTVFQNIGTLGFVKEGDNGGYPGIDGQFIVEDIRYALESKTYTKQCTRPFTGWGRDGAQLRLKNNGPSTVRSGTLIVEHLY